MHGTYFCRVAFARDASCLQIASKSFTFKIPLQKTIKNLLFADVSEFSLGIGHVC